MKRIPTYIKGFDKLVEGGFPEDHAVLLLGTYGSGKTIFGLEYVYNGALKNENTLYITFEEKPEKLKEQAKLLNFSKFDELEKKKKINFYYKPSDEIDKKTVSDIMNKIKQIKPKKVVVDSLSALLINAPLYSLALKKFYKEIMNNNNTTISSIIDSDDLKKNFIYNFIRMLREMNTTSLLLTEIENGISSDKISEYVADGVIHLNIETLGSEVSRNLSIKKMRNTNNKLEVYPFEITKKGIVVQKIN
jgi:KaiC/GvpD/RAD55 family RecA-like ATPase